MSGFGGAYGGLFTSTVIVVMFILELARLEPAVPRRAEQPVQDVPPVLGIHQQIADLLAEPPPPGEIVLLAGVPLGLFAVSRRVLLLMVVVRATTRLFELLKLPGLVRRFWAVWCSGRSAWHCP